MERPANPTAEKASATWIVLLVVAVGLGTFVRFWNIGGGSLWVDEGYSVWVSGLSPAHIVEVIRHDVSPPLYYLLLAGWRGIWGDSETALRSLSAVATVVGLVFMAMTAWRLTRSGPSTLAATLLFALSVLQIQYAQEARSYAMASTLALVAFYCMLRRAESAWWIAGAAGSMLASVWLHNMMWFYVAGLSVAWLTIPDIKRSLRRRVIEIAAVDAVIVVLYLPWVPALVGQMQWLNNNFWASVPSAGDLWQVIVAVSGTKLMHLGMSRWLPWAEIVLLIAVVGLACTTIRNARWSLGVLAVSLMPILMVFAYAHVRQSFFVEKVFTASSIGIPLLAAIAISRYPRTGAAIALGLLVMNTLAVWGYFRWERKEDWRSAVAYVNEVPRKDALVVFVANEGELLYNYYTSRQASFRHQATGAPQGFFDIDPQKTIQRVRKEADLDKLKAMVAGDWPGRVILVYSHVDFSDPDLLTKKWLDAQMKQSGAASFRLIDVYQYERK